MMRIGRYVLVGLVFGGAFSAIGAGKQEFLLDGVAAVVNEHIITVGDVMSAVEPMKRRISVAPDTKAYKKEVAHLYESSMQSLIEKFLILDSDEAAKIQIPEWYVDRRVNEIIKESFAGDRTRFMNILARDRQTFQQWRSELKDHITISSIRSMKVEHSICVSPIEVAAFYEKEKERFVSPGRIQISMIVLNKNTAANTTDVANQLKGRIEAGDDFAALAKAHSDGTYADKGGDWGWIEPDILRSDLREASDGMKEGEVAVVAAKTEIYIFRIEARKDSVKREFKDVQPIVERELKRKKADVESKAWVELLRKSAYIKVNELNLE